VKTPARSSGLLDVEWRSELRREEFAAIDPPLFDFSGQ